MTHIAFRHPLQCTEETYWTHCIFQEEYNRQLYLEQLRFPAYETLERKEDAEFLFQRVRITPLLPPLPGPVKKLIGEHLNYVEEGTFNKAKKQYSFTIIPSVLAQKLSFSGLLYCISEGEKKCVRTIEIDVNVQLFGIGRLIEELLLQELRKSYDISQRFTDAYVSHRLG